MTDWRDNTTWYTGDTLLAGVAIVVLKPIFWAMDKTTVEGLEHVPLKGGCIVAANHFSLYDILTVGLALPRLPHFMAKVELFKNPLLGWFIRNGGSFPVYRGQRDSWALEQAGRILKDGSILFMFPEGTRGKSPQLKRGRVGVAKLALEHQVPIIPTAVLGTQNFKIGWKRNDIKICFGEPLDVATLAGPPPHRHDLPRELTTLMMRKIAEMLPPEHRGKYA